MTITELKYIIAVAKEGHFGRAAASVYVSQPTLSIGIKKLEEELGVTIFERLSNKVIPTPTGERIIEAAKNTLMSTEIIRAIADESKGELAGEIKLGAIYTMCPYLLPKIIPDLRREAPNIQLHIKEDFTHNLLESLKNGDLDVAVVSTPIEQSNLFEIREIGEEVFYIILPTKHHLTAHDSLPINSLQDERVFLLGGGNCFRDQVLQSCPRCFSDKLKDNSLVEGGSLETIRMMVAGGLGVSIFPKMAITDRSNIAVRPFSDNPVPKRKIALVWRKSFYQQSIIDTIEKSIFRCTKSNGTEA